MVLARVIALLMTLTACQDTVEDCHAEEYLESNPGGRCLVLMALIACQDAVEEYVC